jgi:NitT/TauT family transport system substrate-binding protein
MAAENSGITTPNDLKGVEIGISQGTVIEYITTRLLEREALNVQQIELLPVPKIPDRMALLNAGELKAATLPEPLASLVQQQGAVVILDDTQHQDLSCSIFAFRKSFIQANTSTITKFLSVISNASASINADKARWESLLVEKELVPAPLVGKYTIPDFPGDEVPTASQFDDVVKWLVQTERLDSIPVFGDVVDANFLPE